MQMPIKCPVCHGPLLNNYMYLPDTEQLYKKCNKNINHDITFYGYWDGADKDDNVSIMEIRNKGKSIIQWHFTYEEKRITVFTTDKRCQLPYFEPDFSNYKKLLNKIKTYIIFS